MIGFIGLALFLGLSLVVFTNNAVAAEGGVALEGDAAAPAVDADAQIGLDYIYNLTLRNGADTGYYSYIYRGYSYVIWAWFSPSISGYPIKLKTSAIIKGTTFSSKWNHLNTKTFRASGVTGSGSALACEPSGWVKYGQRVKVKVLRPGFYSATRYFYVH